MTSSSSPSPSSSSNAGASSERAQRLIRLGVFLLHMGGGTTSSAFQTKAAFVPRQRPFRVTPSPPTPTQPTSATSSSSTLPLSLFFRNDRDGTAPASFANEKSLADDAGSSSNAAADGTSSASRSIHAHPQTWALNPDASSGAGTVAATTALPPNTFRQGGAGATSPTTAPPAGPANAVNMALVRGIWYNQGAILLFSTAVATLVSIAQGHNPLDAIINTDWTAAVDASPFADAAAWQFPASPLQNVASAFNTAALQGTLAAIPMILLGEWVDKSNSRDAAHMNFSTTNMVISLFGRRRANPFSLESIGNVMGEAATSDPKTTDTFTMAAFATSIAAVTGISEEILFRGYLTAVLMAVTHSLPIAIVGQAMLFGLGHISPTTHYPGENRMVSSLQFANGLMQGALFQLTGGNILPCIIAHFLLDMHVFSHTWTTINDQMDYTQRQMTTTTPKQTSNVQQQGIMASSSSTKLSEETVDFAKRFFYAFDKEHVGSLSLNDTQRAISYAFYHQENQNDIPSTDIVKQVFQQITTSKRLDVNEFLQLLYILKTGKY